MVGGATKEHSYPGAQCFLTGSSIARYFVWDGIRAVDYLLTRNEVDPDRLGITGRSGGGTQSAYIGAMDDRILASAPECYITSFIRLLQSIGPQDAEQNFYHGIEKQIDHADLLEQRVPKPTMMVTTTRDFFSIQGARETADEVQKVYDTFGEPANFSMIEDDAGHASTLKNRERKYAFFRKHFNLPGDTKDETVEFLTPDELQVTKTGQVLISLNGKSAYLVNRERAEKQLANMNKRRNSASDDVKSILPKVKELSGFVYPEKDAKPVFAGGYERTGYTIGKYFVQGPHQYKIPYLLFQPEKKTSEVPLMIYLHPWGKDTEAGRGSEIETMVKKGYAVLAPDLVGVGELGPAGFNGDSYQFELGRGAYNTWFFAVQVGKSMPGIQAQDIIHLIHTLKYHDGISDRKISAMARGNLCNTLLHAAAFEEKISRVALIEPLLSWKSIVMNKYYQPELIPGTVPGAITAYDLPDLVACLAPGKLWMIDVQDHRMKKASRNDIERSYGFAREVYKSRKAQENFVVRSWDRFQSFSQVLEGWL
jgi:cephalosporin-C deacetylase-like acetyl esterase